MKRWRRFQVASLGVGRVAGHVSAVIQRESDVALLRQQTLSGSPASPLMVLSMERETPYVI